MESDSDLVRHLKQRGLLGARGRFGRRVAWDRTSVYHVMSRTVRRSLWLDGTAKEVFRKMLRKQAAFAGVEVLAYCLMDNHFHLMVRVPERPLREAGDHGITDEEMVRRYSDFYGDERPTSAFSLAELKAALAEGGEVAELARCTVLARMGDLSVFMKELKQRFGIWFNRTHGNHGTIWSERFKSILVENRVEVMTRVAAYIDLNPVRAGLVEDPAKYRWSGYGEAMRGSETARAGLSALMGATVAEYPDAVAGYRLILYDKGTSPKRGGGGRTIHAATAERVVRDGGRITWAEALRCRLSEFTETLAIGGDAFREECQARFCRGKTKARKRWSGWQRICERIER